MVGHAVGQRHRDAAVLQRAIVEEQLRADDSTPGRDIHPAIWSSQPGTIASMSLLRCSISGVSTSSRVVHQPRVVGSIVGFGARVTRQARSVIPVGSSR